MIIFVCTICFSCWVSGWGKNDFNGAYQTIQKEVDVPILSASKCQSQLAATRLGSSYMFDSTSFICAGGEPGKDACTVSQWSFQTKCELRIQIIRLELYDVRAFWIIFETFLTGWWRFATGMQLEWSTFCSWIECMGHRLCHHECAWRLCKCRLLLIIHPKQRFIIISTFQFCYFFPFFPFVLFSFLFFSHFKRQKTIHLYIFIP